MCINYFAQWSDFARIKTMFLSSDTCYSMKMCGKPPGEIVYTYAENSNNIIYILISDSFVYNFEYEYRAYIEGTYFALKPLSYLAPGDYKIFPVNVLDAPMFLKIDKDDILFS